MHPTILHISNDFPDPLVPEKTKAVFNLVEGTPRFRHLVYSLNRIDGWSGISAIPFGEDRTAIAYYAPPKGFFWESRLRQVADWITQDLKKRGIVPDLIEAHKFTVEGLIGLQLAELFGKPLICDLQGDTDTRILSVKISLRKRYRQIAAYAHTVFPYAPWPLPMFRKLAGLDDRKCTLLPVVPMIDSLSPAPETKENRLLTVFNVDSWQRKNIIGVMKALTIVQNLFPDISIDVYGRGRPSAFMEMAKAIEKSGIKERVQVMGPALNGSLPDIMKRYVAFILPSKRESYGLVYAEALFSGLPLLFSKNTGIDGYFDEKLVGYACDPMSPADMASGIEYLLTHQSGLKKSIAVAQSNGTFDKIRKSDILDTYERGLSETLRQ